MNLINAQKLFELAHSGPTPEAMFTAWALRERNRESLDVRRFRSFIEKELTGKGVVFDQNAFYKVIAELESMGAGRTTHLIRNLPRYFLWKVSVKDLGTAGIQGLPSGVIKPLRVSQPAKPAGKRKPKPGKGTVGHISKAEVRLAVSGIKDAIRDAFPVTSVGLKIVIPLIGGKVVQIDLPAGLSNGDLESIANGVRAVGPKKSGAA